MSFHSRSVVEFGHLLNTLTASLTDGSPVPVALAVVREHFAAAAVTLEIERRGEETAFFVSAVDAAGGIEATLPDLTERFQQMQAADGGAGAASCLLRVFRAFDAPRFDQEEQDVAGVLVAQIARALELASRINSGIVEKSLYSEALDKLNVGVILVDASGRVCTASAVAERFLRRRDGLQTQAGRLRATNAGEDRLLQAAVREAALACGHGGTSRGVSLTKESGVRTLGVMVRPVPGCEADANARVAVYIRDSDLAPEVESEFVRQIFDLTPAEAAVTRRLTSGLSLEDAATSLDISRNTARAHLRSIFSKSGITRQTELVRLVLNSAALLGDRPRQAA